MFLFALLEIPAPSIYLVVWQAWGMVAISIRNLSRLSFLKHAPIEQIAFLIKLAVLPHQHPLSQRLPLNTHIFDRRRLDAVKLEQVRAV